jgi:hypothetical protein
MSLTSYRAAPPRVVWQAFPGVGVPGWFGVGWLEDLAATDSPAS